MLSSVLPDEIMEEILSRLPVKSLIRWKLVSKSWRELIATDHQFMVKHRKTRANITNVLLKRHHKNASITNYNPIYTIVTSESYPQPVTSVVDTNPVAQFFENEKPKYVNVVAVCDGIFCAHYDFRDVFVWNHSIRDLKVLPKSSPTHPKLPESAVSISASFGLGFNRKSNDYKVVRVWSFFDSEVGTLCNGTVEVCTLSSNSWREIDAVPQTTRIISQCRVVSIKGRCYWKGFIWTEREILVWFDMADEVFQEIQLPDPFSVRIHKNCGRWFEIAELNESLALFSLPLKKNKKCFEVWLMKETRDGDSTGANRSQFSWSKYASIKTNRPKLNPVGFCKKGGLILEWKGKKVFFHNPGTGKTLDSGVELELMEQLFVYYESLVSIN